MSKTFVKICDVRTPEVAAACAAAGADLVGLHCIWESPSEAKRRELNAIVESLQRRCQIVLVTRQTDVETVGAMAQALDWDYLQLHASWNRVGVVNLRTLMTHLGIAPKLIGVVSASESTPDAIRELEEVVDALLIDSSLRGGTGVRAGSDRLHRVISGVSRKPFLIAGGLRPDNVVDVVREFAPWGVDVQSGVERPDGTRQKDVALIKQFVRNVRMLGRTGPESE